MLKLVENGQQWKFEQPVSKQQADKATSYLTSLGFQVRRVSDKSSIKLNAPRAPLTISEEVTEDVVEAEEKRLSRFSDTLELSFKGDALDLTAIYLKLWVFSLLTLGCYSFWGRTSLRQYLWAHLSFGDEPFRYRGTPQGLATTGVKALLTLLGAFFFLLWVHRIDPMLSAALEQLFLGAGLFGLFYLFWRGIGYRLSKTEWHGLTFTFNGTFRNWFWQQLKGWLFFLLSLGLTGPVFWSEAWKFRTEHTTFGGRPLRYSGNWRDLARPWYIGWGVTAITFGWGAPVWLWSLYEIKRALWSATHFDPGTFEFNPDWKSCVRLQIENALILVFSLGLGFPCIKKRNLEFTARHLALVNIPRWSQLLEEIRNGANTKKQQTFQNFKIS